MTSAYVQSFACDDREPLQELLNELYDYGDDLETKILHRSRLNLFHLVLARLVRRGVIRSFGAALDIGCNAGFYSKMLSDAGFQRVVGLDIVEDFVERARRHFASERPGHEVSFLVMNAEEMSTAEEFDLILCTEVIEHISEPDRVLDLIARKLKPGGVAVVTLPNRISLPYLWALFVHAVKRKPLDAVLRDHLRYPSYRAIGLFRKRGLKLLHVTGTNLFFFGGLLGMLYKRPWFATINRIGFELARRAPLKYCAQFFFMVLQKPSSAGRAVEGAAGLTP